MIRSSSIKTTRQYPRPDHICIDNMYVCLLIVQFLSEPQIEQIQNQGMECNLFVEYPLYFSFLGFKRSNPAIVFYLQGFWHHLSGKNSVDWGRNTTMPSNRERQSKIVDFFRHVISHERFVSLNAWKIYPENVQIISWVLKNVWNNIMFSK